MDENEQSMPVSGTPTREAFVRVIGVPEALAAGGELAEVYMTMKRNAGERPAVYNSPTGDAPNIVRCHGLDPRGMSLVFGFSGALQWAPGALPWRLRELINTVTSRANDCFY